MRALVLGLIGSGVLLGALPRRLGARAAWAALVPFAAVTVWAGARVGDSGVSVERLSWVHDLGLDLVFRIDGLAVFASLLIGVVGLAVIWFSGGYLDHTSRPTALVAVMLVFAAAMLGVAAADNVLTLFVFWELTSVCSFLLVGHEHERSYARASARQALLVTGLGGLALLAGLLLLADATGSTSIHTIVNQAPTGAQVSVALVLVLVGALSKSAQVPFQFWLPGAMAAPTPVSAFLHSATMVKAGVLLVARFAPAFGDHSAWRSVVVPIGALTMAMGALVACRRHDLKQLLAYGTVSQLGLLMVLFGLGEPTVTIGAVALFGAHALGKAALFMVVGTIDHQTGTRDLRRLSGLGRTMPGLFVIALLAAASVAGVPPLFGFVAKEAAIAALLDAQPLVGWLVVAGAALTLVYTVRFLWGAFARKPEVEPTPVAHRPGVPLVAPAGVLAGLGVVFGIVPGLVETLVRDAARAVEPVATGTLHLWPGLGVPLFASVGAIVVGVVIGMRPLRVERFLPAWRLPSGEAAFAATQNGLRRAAGWTAASTQRGSLPWYVGVIALSSLVVPTVVLVERGVEVPELTVASSVAQVLIALTAAVCAVACAITRRRLSAAILLGAVGANVGLLFVVQGAPDLALTQLFVEAVSIVAFVLVLRAQPVRYAPARRPLQVRRALAGLVAGAAVVLLMLGAGSDARPVPAGDELVERALPEAGGRNIVNTIIVDFRGFDTLGETTVAAIAALGAMALTAGLTRAGHVRRRPAPLLDTANRLVVPSMLAVSLYLLLAGHNRPGGGFIAGLLAGLAVVLRFVADPAAPPAGRVGPRPLIAAGLALMVTVGVLGWWIDGDFLASGYTSFTLPVFGAVKVFSVLFFDIGVFAVVVGLVIAMLESFRLREVAQ